MPQKRFIRISQTKHTVVDLKFISAKGITCRKIDASPLIHGERYDTCMYIYIYLISLYSNNIYIVICMLYIYRDIQSTALIHQHHSIPPDEHFQPEKSSHFESLTGLQGTSGQAIHDPNFQDFRHSITGCEDSATFHKSHEGRNLASRKTTRRSMESLRGHRRGLSCVLDCHGLSKTEDFKKKNCLAT